MAKYTWASDTHLDFVHEDGILAFANKLLVGNPTGIFITGDIATSKTLTYTLSIIERIVQRPVYYVLGNHDFWDSDQQTVRKDMTDLTNMSQYLKYMHTTPYVALTPATALLGADGWYDGLYADGMRSNVTLNDWTRIREFWAVRNSRSDIITQARKMSHDCALMLHDSIKAAVRYHKNIVVLTHVPPFVEAHTFGGRLGDEHSRPWYTSKFSGDVLLDAARSFPNVNFTVLCGHTHSAANVKIAPNLMCRCAPAEYGLPEPAGTIDVI